MKRKRFLFRKRLGAFLLAFMLLPDAGTCLSLKLPVRDVTGELFLGEHVRLSNSGGSVERQMMGLSDEAYLRLTERCTVTTFWETADGTEIGGWKDLQKLTPAEDKTYRLRILISSRRGEVHSLAPPVPLIEYEALYRVKVIPGTIAVRVTAGKGKFDEDDQMEFTARKESGETYSCTALPETDPETGERFLAGTFSQLPYGVYTVAPAGGEEEFQGSRACLLGVWDQDDTVSVHRSNTIAEFVLQ